MTRKPAFVTVVFALAVLLVISGVAFAGGKGGNKNNKGTGFVFGPPFPQETYLLPYPEPEPVAVRGLEPTFGKFEYNTVGESFCFDFKSNLVDLEPYTGQLALVAVKFDVGPTPTAGLQAVPAMPVFVLGFPELKDPPSNKNWDSVVSGQILALDGCCADEDLLDALAGFPPSVVIALVELHEGAFEACSVIDSTDVDEVILCGTTLISFNPEFLPEPGPEPVPPEQPEEPAPEPGPGPGPVPEPPPEQAEPAPGPAPGPAPAPAPAPEK